MRTTNVLLITGHTVFTLGARERGTVYAQTRVRIYARKRCKDGKYGIRRREPSWHVQRVSAHGTTTDLGQARWCTHP